MQFHLIYSQLAQTAKTHRDQFFGRKLFVMRYEDFKVFEQHFVMRRNILNQHINMRTKQIFRHIHAIVQDDVVEFHIDYANPDKNVGLAVVHLFVDVIPYFLSRIVRYKRPYSLK